MRIEEVEPRVDCGRYPAKRTVGDLVEVEATIVRDGPDVVRAVVRYRPPGARAFREQPLVAEGNDRFVGSFEVDRPGRWTFTVEAWTDRLATWRQELSRKATAGQSDLRGELAEGARLLATAERRLRGAERELVAAVHAVVADERVPQPTRVDAALDEGIGEALARADDRADAVTTPRQLELDVDVQLARFGAWYELFPRSWGGLAGVEQALPELARLGFDVVYLPPIHPIGRTNRKGPNNAPRAAAGDPGSPWAIGAAEGGHDAIHPGLGDLDDFARLVARARELGLELALDLALQCSPDHPWLAAHPDWFRKRPDGTIAYAENPPKRYEDIVGLDWDAPSWRSLWNAVHGVVTTWVERGVTVFRVDNPHTKPFALWEWLIPEVRKRHPEVVFLAEAFTRPAPMRTLAKLGFAQSYTYFTWRTTRRDLMAYVEELAGETAGYLRPNFFANTPDILHASLVDGGRPAFEARLVLAATLSPSYGIYSGFEHCENVPVRPGSEEYLDSEKYEARARQLDGPLLPLIARVNAFRRDHPALQHLDGVTFLETHQEELIAYARHRGDDVVLCVVNLDPHRAHEGLIVVPPGLGLPAAFTVHDVVSGERHRWLVGGNYVRLDPAVFPAHLLAVEA